MHTSQLGKLDRIFRFLLAFWWIGPLAPQSAASWLNVVIAVIAWISLIESFIGKCWLHRIFNINNTNQ